MLTESFIAATLNPEKSTNTTSVGIHLHHFQPNPALKSTIKKSSVKPNCLAVSDSHIFAAQADKAVVHVYSRERNNQEAVVAFPERICSIALTGERDGGGILALGMEGGRLVLWELGTGRQVATPQHHLQSVDCLVADRTSNFLLSGSADSNIHVWSLPKLLSFSASSTNDSNQDVPLSPLRSLSSHQAAITSVMFGHSASRNNIAVSVSKDGTCIVWDYFRNLTLHTFLLPSTPICMALDPVDRAVYVGNEDGSIHLVDFYKNATLTQPLHNGDRGSALTQQTPSDQWISSEVSTSPVLSIQVSYDGTILLSSHQDGKIHSWDIAKGKYGNRVVDFAAPVTNLLMLAPTGFPNVKRPNVLLHQVVKPRYESFADGGSASEGAVVPINYEFTAQMSSNLPLPGSEDIDSFRQSLSHPSFPPALLEEHFRDFASPTPGGQDSEACAELRAQNASLSIQLADAVERQRAAAAAIQQRDKEERRRNQDGEIKATRKKLRRQKRIEMDEILRKKQMGEPVDNGDVEMAGNDSEDDDLRSSTDELTDSD